MTRMIDPTELSGARAGQRSQERRPDTADVYLLARQMQADAIARTTQMVVSKLAELVGRGIRGARSAFAKHRARRRTVAELSQLDARSLADIGINPHDITGAVDRLFAQQQAEAAGATATGHDFGETLRPVEEDMAPVHARTASATLERPAPANSQDDARPQRRAA
ncbi:DUF1127 domain-containing protein [Rhodovibrio salinarum]|nr:DUF1127 domain-containing protein [Rhodovibrio salinarum]